ncbi:MAG: cytochrome c [Cyclobacteriaceae bacterium]|nr:cytochrome c [Cyclobacteriaceae bacterium]
MLFTALFHTHKLVVLLFAAIYLIKTILLLIGSNNGLDKFTKIIKIPEMIISLLFLLTGGYLIMEIAAFDMLFIIKLVFVFASIPLAIIGFKKKKKIFAVISILLIIGAYGLAEVHKARMGKRHDFKEEVITNPSAQNYVADLHGKALYNAQCTVCHGANGLAGLSGAKNLQISKKSDAEITSIINTGKSTMPKMDGKFNAQEMKALVDYVKSLRGK